MEKAFHGSGAFKFGILTNINTIVGIIGTPIFTKKLSGVIDIRIMYFGQLLESLGIRLYIKKHLPLQREYQKHIVSEY